MKKISMLLVVLASVALCAGMAFAAKTYTYPSDAPVLSIDFPDDWSVELDQEDVRGVYATSPDEAIEFDIWPLDEKEVGDDVDAALKAEAEGIDEFIAEYATDFKAGEPSTFEVNGIKFVEVAGPAKDKEDGSDITISAAFFSPDGKTMFALVYWGNPDAETKYADQLKAIIQSFKKP
ncbi:hypothetical protein U14_03045 [Candidatus Moduliflexus flocculans]|uniref:Histidine kinase n=1 Tax=Candidatus Moduliflexus flocculans TaxID=1499966 RepID=A0A081BN33_9BACT|nr:hypothetical protein U14_03045 [Candidatus Moduliflexus flocculans]